MGLRVQTVSSPMNCTYVAAMFGGSIEVAKDGLRKLQAAA